MLDAQLQPPRCLDPSRGNRLQRLELPAPADDAGSGSAVRRGGLVTPRVSSWSAPTFPAPSGDLVGGPYGSLDAAPEQRRIPPARGTAPPSARRQQLASGPAESGRDRARAARLVVGERRALERRLGAGRSGRAAAAARVAPVAVGPIGAVAVAGAAAAAVVAVHDAG